MSTTIKLVRGEGTYTINFPTALLNLSRALQDLIPDYDSKRTEAYVLPCLNLNAMHLMFYHHSAGLMCKITTRPSLDNYKDCLMLMKTLGVKESSVPFVSLLNDIREHPDFHLDYSTRQSILSFLENKETISRVKSNLCRDRLQTVVFVILCMLFCYLIMTR